MENGGRSIPPPDKPARRRPPFWALLALFALTGVLIGAGAFTAIYAEAFSYLSDEPTACVNCHIMRPQYEGWAASPHHAVATCNDCHVPHTSFFAKWWGKAQNGYHHSRAFTLQNHPDPIRIKPGNAAVLQENCVRCHDDMVSGIVGHAPPGGATDDDPGSDAPSCVFCHRTVGHGAPR